MMYMGTKTFLGYEVTSCFPFSIKSKEKLVITRNKINETVKFKGVKITSKRYNESTVGKLVLSSIPDNILDKINTHLSKKLVLNSVYKDYADLMTKAEFKLKSDGTAYTDSAITDEDKQENLKKAREELEKHFESKMVEFVNLSKDDKRKKLYKDEMKAFVNEQIKIMESLYFIEIECKRRMDPVKYASAEDRTIHNVKLPTTERKYIHNSEAVKYEELKVLLSTVMTEDERKLVQAELDYRDALSRDKKTPEPPKLKGAYVSAISTEPAVSRDRIKTVDSKKYFSIPFIKENIAIDRAPIKLDTSRVTITGQEGLQAEIDVDAYVKITDYVAYYDYISDQKDNYDTAQEVLNSLFAARFDEKIKRYIRALPYYDAIKLDGETLLNDLGFELFELGKEAGLEFQTLMVKADINKKMSEVAEARAKRESELELKAKENKIEQERIEGLKNAQVDPNIAVLSGSGVSSSGEGKVNTNGTDFLTYMAVSGLSQQMSGRPIQNYQPQDVQSDQSQATGVSQVVIDDALDKGYVNENGFFMDPDDIKYLRDELGKSSVTRNIHISQLNDSIYNKFIQDMYARGSINHTR